MKTQKSVFLLGLGTGITLSAIESWPVDRIVCSEIEPRVVEASHVDVGLVNEEVLAAALDRTRATNQQDEGSTSSPARWLDPVADVLPLVILALELMRDDSDLGC